MTTHYGAIRGLTELGDHVIDLLLVPNVRYCSRAFVFAVVVVVSNRF